MYDEDDECIAPYRNTDTGVYAIPQEEIARRQAAHREAMKRWNFPSAD